MTDKKIQSLMEDMTDMLVKINKGEQYDISEHVFDDFGKACADALRRQLTPRVAKVSGTVSMSNLGTPDRKLWYQVHFPLEASTASAPARVKFIYGDLIENLILALVEASGHTVSNQQERVYLYTKDGQHRIAGHKDCHIDGVLVDVKSTTSYGYNTKWQKGALKFDDPFGYRIQLAGYASSETADSRSGSSRIIGGIRRSESVEFTDRQHNPQFLVIDKQHGDFKLVPLDYDEDPQDRLLHVLMMLDEETEPMRCYPLIPEGKSGNMALHKNCTYCEYKHRCFQDANDGKGLRMFKYKGTYGMEIKYLAVVKKEPRVEEIDNG